MREELDTAVAMPLASSETIAVPDSFDTLVRRYHAKLLKFLSVRLHDHNDVADVAQDTYVRLLRVRGKRSAEDLRRMLFRTAENLLNNHWRWKRVRKIDSQLTIDELEIADDEPGPDRQLEAQERLQRLRAVILAMPPKRRIVFTLSRIEGLTNLEIAQRCGISVKAVEKHIASALCECRIKVGHDASDVL